MAILCIAEQLFNLNNPQAELIQGQLKPMSPMGFLHGKIEYCKNIG